MSKRIVRRYYDVYGMKEWERLAQDSYHSLEYITTMEYLKKHLPRRGVILDAGGGPGRYALQLAKMKYDVVLLDISPRLLQIAEGKFRKYGVMNRIKEVHCGSVDNLSMFQSNTFDAVICLGGALSHIVKTKDRDRALFEIKRVVKSGAVVFISVIGRKAVLVKQLTHNPKEIINNTFFTKIRDTGNYTGKHGFAPTHFYEPNELTSEITAQQMKVLDVVGLEGIAAGHRDKINALFPSQKRLQKLWIETHLRTCAHSDIIGLSEHFLVVARKVKSKRSK